MEIPKSKLVGVKMPVDLNSKIEAIAASENNSVSSVVRRLLTDAVAREAAQKERRVLA